MLRQLARVSLGWLVYGTHEAQNVRGRLRGAHLRLFLASKVILSTAAHNKHASNGALGPTNGDTGDGPVVLEITGGLLRAIFGEPNIRRDNRPLKLARQTDMPSAQSPTSVLPPDVSVGHSLLYNELVTIKPVNREVVTIGLSEIEQYLSVFIKEGKEGACPGAWFLSEDGRRLG